jgi:hypothetical protein
VLHNQIVDIMAGLGDECESVCYQVVCDVIERRCGTEMGGV